VVGGVTRGKARARLTLLGGFGLWLDDSAVDLPLSAQRLLAFLGLHESPLQRRYVAGTLWGEYEEGRSLSNLRSSLARLPRKAGHLVCVVGRQLSLADWVSVDVRETSWLMRRVIDRDERVLRIQGVHRRLMTDILPGWYDEWVLVEHERYRELRLQALETLCDAFIVSTDFAPAIEAGLAAAAAEPLRETAQRALIRAYLAQGNQVAAVRQYRRFHSLLERELGLTPSPSLTALIPGNGKRPRSRLPR
jgi:DNA-binding SARP family transcriptional activator